MPKSFALPPLFVLAAAALVLVGCIRPLEELERDVAAFDAGSSSASVPRPRTDDRANCEVKSNQNEPCLVDDEGEEIPASSDNEARALAVPFPSQCKPDAYEVERRDYPQSEIDAYVQRISPSNEACWDYMNKLSNLFPGDGDLPPKVDKAYRKAWDIAQSYNLTVAMMASASAPAEPVHTPPQSIPAASGDGCANPFGGNPATHDQFICSDQGELQACQCSGGSCKLIPTGSFLCTVPGAVIR